jgi:hypothetical protein
VDGESNIVTFLKSDEFADSGIRAMGVMEEISCHAFLHKKHKDMVPALSLILKKMKEEGLLEKYRKLSGFENLIIQK